MAALLDHAMRTVMVCYETVDVGTVHSNGLLCAFRRTYVFRRAGGDVRRYVECSPGVQRGVAYGMAGGVPLRWGSRCVEVTQRAAPTAEEESQHSAKRVEKRKAEMVTTAIDPE